MGMIGNTLAQGLISGANIQDGTVDTADIKSNAITPSKLSIGAPTWDASGNLGVGAALSVGWQAGRSVIQLSTAALDTFSAGQLVIRANNLWNGTNDKYISNGYATAYEQSGGTHRWYTAASGTAGNNVSFNQIAMFDTNGSLYIGATSSDLSGGGTTTRISANGATGYGATNVNTGSAAYSVYQLGNNNTANRAGVALFGSGWTNSGLYRQDGVYLYSGGSGGVTIAAEQAQPIYFATSNTERARFNAGAPILCLAGGNTSATGAGIAFPASFNASSDVNTLDDYEEGDWTPRLTGTGGSGIYTPGSINGGRYVKIGKMVWATATLQWTGVVSAYSGNLAVSGLPFTSTGQRAAGSMGAVQSGLSFTAGYGEWNYLVDPGYTFVYIIQNSTTGSGYSHSPAVGSSGIVYALSVVYEAA